MPRPRKPKIPKRIDPYLTALLEKTSAGKHVLKVRKGEKLFAQGDAADSIFFLQTGKVKISVVSRAGKEAVLTDPLLHD